MHEKVALTGASGYIAVWTAKMLLEQGYTVHGSVRNLSNKGKVEPLKKLESEFPGKLLLFEADLTKPGSFDECFKGCTAVIHMASPFIINKNVQDPQKQLIEPAEGGTQTVLESVNKTESITKVIITSSVAAIYGDNIEMQELGRPYIESDWNATSTINHQPYSYSKVLAEKKAWEMHDKQNRWKMATINPSMVIGPSLTQATITESVAVFKEIVDGTNFMGLPDMSLGVVDVRDVAQAHINALKDDMTGRFILCKNVETLWGIRNVIKKVFPGKFKLLPVMIAPKAFVMLVGPVLQKVPRKFIKLNIGYPLAFDNKRSREELGISYIPLETTVKDHVQQMLDDGIV